MRGTNKFRIIVLLCLLFFFFSGNTVALIFTLKPGEDVVGKVRIIKVKPGSNFTRIAQHYDVGFYALAVTNPQVKPDALKSGTKLIIPTQFILPLAKSRRKGIIINLAEMRLYYFPKGKHIVFTAPLGIGYLGPDWSTPSGIMRVTEKIKKPDWYPPESVRQFRKEHEGVVLPKVIYGGDPNNPLGDYALRLSLPHYFIHGTNQPAGIGRRSSAGCIRMYAKDIKYLYNHIKKGTPVHIINHSYKAGWKNKKLYLEAHLPLQENQSQGDIEPVIKVIDSKIKQKTVNINWEKAFTVAKESIGIPAVVGYIS